MISSADKGHRRVNRISQEDPFLLFCDRLNNPSRGLQEWQVSWGWPWLKVFLGMEDEPKKVSWGVFSKSLKVSLFKPNYMAWGALLCLTVYQEFDHLLEEQSPIESYIEWLDTMVDRCVVKVGQLSRRSRPWMAVHHSCWWHLGHQRQTSWVFPWWPQSPRDPRQNLGLPLGGRRQRESKEARFWGSLPWFNQARISFFCCTHWVLT